MSKRNPRLDSALSISLQKFRGSLTPVKGIKKVRKNKEAKLQTAVADYINLQYPNIIFTSESSGIRVPIGLAVQMKRQRSRKWKLPDLIILHTTKKYSGLIIELKNERSDVFKKDGNYRIGEHIQDQRKTLNELTKLGYKAEFGCGFFECKKIIDNYLK